RVGAGSAERSAWNHAKAQLRLSPRFAAHQAAPVPRHRFLSANPGNSAERARWRALSAAEHPAGSCNSRRRRGECSGRRGRHSVSRGLPARGRQDQGSRMSIWRSVLSLDELNANSGTLPGSLGIVFTEIGDDFVRGTMPVDERTRQPYGLLHGGASLALAETLGSTGAAM